MQHSARVNNSTHSSAEAIDNSQITFIDDRDLAAFADGLQLLK
jgi:hypothetical protein